MENYSDADIERALNWLMSFMHEKHWPERFKEIENQLTEMIHNPGREEKTTKDMKVIKNKKDQIGWYMYLMQKLTTDITKYESYQGARVAMVFKRIGMELDSVKKVGGIEKKVKKMLKSDKSQADSTLFEILVASLWVRNGYTVSFVPEGSGRSADLLAINGDDEWAVECKRLQQRSAYSIKEQDKWLAMLSHVSNFLMTNNLLLEVVFHKELHLLEETLLKDMLFSAKASPEGNYAVNNENLSFKASKINLSAINKELEKSYVKYGSPYLRKLVGGDSESTGFTVGMSAQMGTFGEKAGFNQYVVKIEKIYGVDWKCDAPDSIASKARDIWQQLIDANGQLPGSNSAIHIGLETLDGTEVELERFKRITENTAIFDKGLSGLKMVYCHFFQSYSLPNVHFVYDETVVSFNEHSFTGNPLETMHVLMPEESTGGDTLHWLKPYPGKDN